MMSFVRRRLIVVVETVLVLSAFPALGFVQCDWGAASLMADGYYDEASNTWNIDVQGTDLSAGCCYHIYAGTIDAATAGGTYSAQFEIQGVMTESYAFDGPVDYAGWFGIGCLCVGGLVGVAEVHDSIPVGQGAGELPQPSVDVDPPSISAYLGDPDVVLTASVSPTSAAPFLTWTGDGTTNPSNGLQRIMSTAAVGPLSTTARVGAAQTPVSGQVLPAPSPCVPALQQSFISQHRYIFSNDDFWATLDNEVDYAASLWNGFQFTRTPIQAFTRVTSSATFTVYPGYHLIGTDSWGEFRRGTVNGVWINPEVFLESPSFWNSVILHEFGHMRGYAHVVAPCSVSSSIMFAPTNPPAGQHPISFGSGDSAALVRELP